MCEKNMKENGKGKLSTIMLIPSRNGIWFKVDFRMLENPKPFASLTSRATDVRE